MRIPHREYENIWSAYQKGEKAAAIGGHYGVTANTIWNILRKMARCGPAQTRIYTPPQRPLKTQAVCLSCDRTFQTELTKKGRKIFRLCPRCRAGAGEYGAAALGGHSV